MVLGTQNLTNKYTDQSCDIKEGNSSTKNGSVDANKKLLNVILNDVSLKRVTYTKFLGVIIDENLTLID